MDIRFDFQVLPTGIVFPYLKGFKGRASGPDTIEYKIGEIFGEIENKFRSGYSLRDALRKLPPLIKAYLRLGAFVGDGAVIDQAFGTTDVFILLSVDRIADRYLNRFDRRTH